MKSKKESELIYPDAMVLLMEGNPAIKPAEVGSLVPVIYRVF